jgi:hypothetical protein
LLPLFIEWGKESVHRWTDASGGCHIERCALANPDANELSNALRRIEVEAPLEHSPAAHQLLRIAGLKGALEIPS